MEERTKHLATKADLKPLKKELARHGKELARQGRDIAGIDRRLSRMEGKLTIYLGVIIGFIALGEIGILGRIAGFLTAQF